MRYRQIDLGRFPIVSSRPPGPGHSPLPPLSVSSAGRRSSQSACDDDQCIVC